MNNSFFDPESFLEKGQSLVTSQVKATSQALTGQAGVKQPSGDTAGSAGQDKAARDFIAEIYGTSSDSTPQTQQNQTAMPQGVAPQPQTGDDQSKLAETRQKLALAQKAHKERHDLTYYKPTFEERPRQEERVAEKIERQDAEEKQKRWELQEKEAKNNEIPIAVRMATNKAEQFRGAAG